jgi:hypothetical protein
MRKILILCTCILWYSGIFAQDKKVAVFDPSGNVSLEVQEIVREEISSIVMNIPKYSVLAPHSVNKALRENKFQIGGVVDDVQISELGRKMGADFVIVTSITPIGENLYISCKQIDVQSARLKTQKTGKTNSGENDIDVVVQKIVRDMFGIAQTATAPPAQPVKDALPAQAFSTPQQLHSSLVMSRGTKVFYKEASAAADWTELSRDEVRTLFAGTSALNKYNRGVSLRKAGNALVGVGFGTLFISAGCLVYAFSESTSIDYAEIFGYVAGASLVTAIITFSVGIPLNIAGRVVIKNSVATYNKEIEASGYASQLQFGFTGNGIGLRYTF